MSHFSVLVIDSEGYSNTSEYLEPYDENRCRTKFYDCTDEVLKDWEELEAEEKRNYSSMEEFASEYHSYSVLNNEKGEHYGYFENPNAKWDWWKVGGRWSNMITLKNGTKRDSAPIGLIDLEALKHDPEVFKESERFWELYVEGQEIKTKEDRELIEFVMQTKEWYLNRFKTKEDYARQTASFYTYAVLKDGEWFEKGSMGWFGCGSETFEESYNWVENFYDNFLADLPETAHITVVDCHI